LRIIDKLNHAILAFISAGEKSRPSIEVVSEEPETGWSVCAYTEHCKIECGHKGVHKTNTGCLNMCVNCSDELPCRIYKGQILGEKK
jgi:hypothetical protein